MSFAKEHNILRRKIRTRAKIHGTEKRPRLVVRKSLKNVYVQLVNDETGKVITSVSYKNLKDKAASTMEKSQMVGELVAVKAKEAGIQKVVFDRGPYKYHGHILAVAEGARKQGLEF